MKKIIAILVFTVLQVNAQITPVKVACIGNSITIGWGLPDPSKAYPQQLAGMLGSGYEVKNFGVSGRTMLKKGDYPYWKEPEFKAALDYNPQILTICLGTNDSKPWNWVYKDDFFSNYAEMVNDFKKVNPHMQIFVCLPPPVFNSNSAGISDSVIHYEIIPVVDSVWKTLNTYRIDFYDQMLNDKDYFKDGIHPNEAGATIMANIIYHTFMNNPGGIIRQFNAKSTVFEKGNPVVLYWQTTTGSNVTINGQQVNDTDSLTVYPSGTTTYTLVTNGTVSDTAAITVQYMKPGTIKTFTVNNSIADKGYHQSRILKWSAAKGSTVTLNGAAVQPVDSLSIAPDSTTIYVLAASGDTNSTSSVTIRVLAPENINRVLCHDVNASQFVSNNPASLAVDGDTTTYWQSQTANPQWITADMKDTYSINRVVVHWEKAYAISYRLVAINEKGDTTDLYSTNNGTGGINDLSGLKGSGRYVSLICTGRNYPSIGYRLKELEVYGTPAVVSNTEKAQNKIPASFLLEQNYPNPFNPSTVIRWYLGSAGHVSIKIYDILGNEVATLVNEFQSAGVHSAIFDSQKIYGRGALSSGIYFCRLTASGTAGELKNFSDTRKMILMK